MKKKAELLQQAFENLLTQCKRIAAYLPVTKLDPTDYRGDDGVTITANEAHVLIEALESLRWAAMYESDERNQIGREHTNFEDADYLGRLAEGVDYIETVGIIRLKDSQDENQR